MRTSKLTADEVWAAEKAADDRKRSRKTGFDMMHTRDQGYTHLSNGVIFLWPVDRDKLPAGTVLPNIPEGHFKLVIGGKEYLFDADEFAKWTRWV
jgi:hypothetical protein